MKNRISIIAFLLLFPLLAQAGERFVAVSTGLDIWILRITTEGKVLEAHRRHADYFATTVGILPVQTSSGPALGVFRTENAVDVTLIESALFQNGEFGTFHEFNGPVLSDASVLQVTQKPASNWLLARSRIGNVGQLYKSFGINSNLEWNKKSTPVVPALAGFISAVSVSADGRMVIESLSKEPVGAGAELVLQPLAADGSRKGSPFINALTEDASSVDCSNAAADGTRKIIYRLSHVVGIDTISTGVVVQSISAAGKLEGAAMIVAPQETRVVTIADLPQSVSMDPQSEFVLYTAAGECGKKVLKFQPIDAAGNPSASAKVIFGCGRVSGTQSGVESVDVSMASNAP